MDPTTLRLIQGAAGAAKSATYVDDVFSTYLYTGTGTSFSINNGIDLSSEGGAVWLKARSNTTYLNHTIADSARGVDSSGNYKVLYPNLGDAEYEPGSATNATVTSFNDNGFTLGINSNTNWVSQEYVSWNFRKAPGFFDVVTWAGNGTAGREIAHNLGSVPGCIIIKCTSSAGSDWIVYHRSLGAEYNFRLNKTDAAQNAAWPFNDTEPTASVFTVGSDNWVNGSSETYVAYLFAHDVQSFGTDEDEAIIKCGVYTGNGSNDGPEVNLGFEAQWVMTKAVTLTRNWIMGDVMRGTPVSSGAQDAAKLSANTNDYETLGDEPFVPTSTGFKVRSNSGTINDNGLQYIYIAIRRPNKPPTGGTDVFDIDTFAGSGSAEVISTPFTVDASLTAWRNRNFVPTFIDRLRGASQELFTAGTQVEYTNPNPAELDFQTGLQLMQYSGDIGYNLVSYSFKRAPGFLDIVTWDGDGTSSRNIQHNLETSAELIIGRRRDVSGNWTVWSNNLSSGHILQLNGTDAEISVGSSYINSSTSTTFNIGSDSDVNASGGDYVAYLFATLDGISKVGTYSGTGSDVNVDCGFSAGARFILIRRTDSTGDWYVFDTARGIVAGNEEYILLNEDGNTTTSGVDYIDPLNSGFTVTSSAPAEMNASGGTYLFLAFA